MLTLLFVGLAGVNLDVMDAREGRLLLQVRDDASGAALEGAQVQVEGLNGPVARGTSNAAGYAGPTFRAPTVMLRSLPGPGPYWIVLRVAAPDLSCSPHDFVEASGVRSLTRGVALRKVGS